VIRAEILEHRGRGQGLRLVVDQPGSGVGVIVLWDITAFEDEHHVDIQGIPDSKVLAGIRLSMNQDRSALSRGNPKQLVSNGGGISVYTIDLDDSHLVAIEHPSVTGPVAQTDHMNQVGLIGQHLDLGVAGIVDQRRVRYRLPACKGSLILLGLVFVNQVRHLTVVPVGQRDGELVIVVERWLGIMNNERATEAVGVLAHVVGVVPVSSSLVNLLDVSMKFAVSFSMIYLRQSGTACAGLGTEGTG